MAGINADVLRWSRQCLQCQRAKVQRHTVTPLSQFPEPTYRFNNLHIDLVVPLPPSKRFTYLLTVVDRFTRWVEAIPLVDIAAETVAHTFMSHWVSRFGAPAFITTDQGRQFKSTFWSHLMKVLATERGRTTACIMGSHKMKGTALRLYQVDNHIRCNIHILQDVTSL